MSTWVTQFTMAVCGAEACLLSGSEFQELPQSGHVLWTNSGGLIVPVAWDGVLWMGQRSPPGIHTPAVTSDPDVLGAVGF